MDDKIKHIIDSGLLEAYFLGLTDEKQSHEIDFLLENSPELKNRQKAFDDLLFDMTGAMNVTPPSGLKEKIKESISKEESIEKPQAEMRIVQEKIKPLPRWMMAAASILLLAFAWVAYSNFNTAKNMSADLAEVRKELKIQKIQNLEISRQLSTLADEFAFLNHSDTKKYILQGNPKAKELNLAAYWNDTAKKSMISLHDTPKLPPGKCLQMWADVDGEMISVGIISAEKTYVDIKYLENATSLNITIEPKGGSDHPTVSDLVSSVLMV